MSEDAAVYKAAGSRRGQTKLTLPATHSCQVALALNTSIITRKKRTRIAPHPSRDVLRDVFREHSYRNCASTSTAITQGLFREAVEGYTFASKGKKGGGINEVGGR
jgi:hypothetical protein